MTDGDGTDVRIEQILRALTEFAAGNHSCRLERSKHDDHLEAIVVGMNMLGEELGESERRVQEANERLLHGEKMAAIGRLAGGVAHEINTPIQFAQNSAVFIGEATHDLLALVGAYRDGVQSLASGASWEAIRPALVRAESDADLDYVESNLRPALHALVEGLTRVAAIVRSLNAFAHPTGGSMEAFDLNQAVLNALALGRTTYQHVADVLTDLEDLPLVRGHPGAVQQALLNLVVNAADTIASARGNTNARGLITVRTRRDAECVIVSLEDTGSGISDDIRTRIYDLFFTTKGVGEGTGQGLAIARSIVVDTHGGELWFETDPGQGTTFFIRLNIEGPGHG